jgi:hypothetical protein
MADLIIDGWECMASGEMRCAWIKDGHSRGTSVTLSHGNLEVETATGEDSVVITKIPPAVLAWLIRAMLVAAWETEGNGVGNPNPYSDPEAK